MIGMPRTVFVSSTFVDLQTHRKAVWEALAAFDVTIRGMEQFGARTETPLETCLIEVDQSDIYIGVIAFRLGSIETASGKSFTQLEYERAVKLSKEVFIYLIDEENAPVLIKFVDRGESRDKLDSFKRTLRERHTVDTFIDEGDLVAKLKRDLERHISPRVQALVGTNEYITSKSRLDRFFLLPKSVAGTDVRLRVRAKASPYAASRACCDAFNFEFGATLGLPIEVLQPEGVQPPELPDLYVNSKHAADILPIVKGDQLDGYVRLHFSDEKIPELRARFHSITHYPNSPFSTTPSSVLGEPVHYVADLRLAIELSKLVEIKRASDSAE